mgnify:CR=1 FL=1
MKRPIAKGIVNETENRINYTFSYAISAACAEAVAAQAAGDPYNPSGE